MTAGQRAAPAWQAVLQCRGGEGGGGDGGATCCSGLAGPASPCTSSLRPPADAALGGVEVLLKGCEPRRRCRRLFTTRTRSSRRQARARRCRRPGRKAPGAGRTWFGAQVVVCEQRGEPGSAHSRRRIGATRQGCDPWAVCDRAVPARSLWVTAKVRERAKPAWCATVRRPSGCPIQGRLEGTRLPAGALLLLQPAGALLLLQPAGALLLLQRAGAGRLHDADHQPVALRLPSRLLITTEPGRRAPNNRAWHLLSGQNPPRYPRRPGRSQAAWTIPTVPCPSCQTARRRYAHLHRRPTIQQAPCQFSRTDFRVGAGAQRWRPPPRIRLISPNLRGIPQEKPPKWRTATPDAFRHVAACLPLACPPVQRPLRAHTCPPRACSTS